MSQDFLYKAILGSIVSEKSTRIGEKNNQYVFRVVPEATKEDVKAHNLGRVKLLFKVKVKGVQMLNLKGKQKRNGRFPGKRNDVRKAYVCLEEGQEINFAEVK